MAICTAGQIHLVLCVCAHPLRSDRLVLHEYIVCYGRFFSQ